MKIVKNARFAFIISLITVVLLLGGIAPAQQTITIESTKGGPGAIVYIPVHLSDGCGIGGINATVNFSPGVISNISMVKGDLLNTHVVDYNTVSSMEFRFLAYANPTASFNSGAGYVGYIKGTISQSATPGSQVTVTLTDSALGTTDGQSVEDISTVNGVIDIYPAAFSFDVDSQGWQFKGKVSEYDEPDYTDQGGHLGLNALGSTKSFSYWESTDLPIQDGKVYRAAWTVGSSVTDPNLAVQYRLRVNQKDSWQAWERIVDSYKSQSPSAGNPKTYNLFFDPSLTGVADDVVVYSFDILSFNTEDDTNSWLYLDEMVVSEVAVTEGAQVASYDFESDGEGWQFSGPVPPYNPLSVALQSGKLALSPDGAINAFAYVFSPEITIEDAKVYRVRYEVGSTTSDADQCIRFRTRLNQKGAWQGLERDVNSFNGQAPANMTTKYYHLIYAPLVTDTEDNKMDVSFDVLSFESADDVNSWVYLESLTVNEVTLSE